MIVVEKPRKKRVAKGSLVIHNGDTNRRGWVGEVTHLGEYGIDVKYTDFICQTYTPEWFYKNMLVVVSGLKKSSLRGDKMKTVPVSEEGFDSREEGGCFIVWSREGERNPKRVHNSYYSASKEALRLEKITGKKFFPAELKGAEECAGYGLPPSFVCQEGNTLKSVKVADFGNGVRVEIPDDLVRKMRKAGKKAGFKVISAFKDEEGRFYKAKSLSVLK